MRVVSLMVVILTLPLLIAFPPGVFAARPADSTEPAQSSLANIILLAPKKNVQNFSSPLSVDLNGIHVGELMQGESMNLPLVPLSRNVIVLKSPYTDVAIVKVISPQAGSTLFYKITLSPDNTKEVLTEPIELDQAEELELNLSPEPTQLPVSQVDIYPDALRVRYHDCLHRSSEAQCQQILDQANDPLSLHSLNVSGAILESAR